MGRKREVEIKMDREGGDREREREESVIEEERGKI